MLPSDWILLALYVAGKNSLQPVQLQKSLFIMGEKRHPGGEFYHFEPYHYGPFSRQIYDDADALARDGWITIVPEARNLRRYDLTPRGWLRAQELLQKYKPDHETLKAYTRWVQSLGFRQLVSAIYEHFPQYKANSVFS